jgi:hypothetical protein
VRTTPTVWVAREEHRLEAVLVLRPHRLEHERRIDRPLVERGESGADTAERDVLDIVDAHAGGIERHDEDHLAHRARAGVGDAPALQVLDAVDLVGIRARRP